MGIETTCNINRLVAVDRIKDIIKSIEEGDWIKLHEIAENEVENLKDDYVNEYNDIHKEYLKYNTLFKDVSNWPVKYLEEFMDKPGIRFSMFENYFIKNDLEIYTEPQGLNKFYGLTEPQGSN